MFRDLPRHAAYKSNSSPWLGDLPAHWSLARTKTLLTERSQKGYPDEPLLAATQSHGVIRKSDYETRTVTATKDLHLLKLVEVGDFVISLRSFQGGIERCYHRGIISPAYTVLTAHDDSSRDYLTYLFKSSRFIDSLTLAVTGIREGQNIDYSRLAVDLLPVPPVEEQAAIVKYLAHANTRIDNAIAAKRRLIALLEEQKSLLAEHAIFGEPCDGIQRRDSAVPWLGEVPVEWDLAAVRYTFRAVTRTPIGNEEKFSVTQKQGLVRTDAMEENSTQAGSFENFQACHPGDLVLNKYKAHLGVFWGAKEPGLITPNYSVFKPVRPVNNDFIEILFRTSRYIQAFRHSVYGVTEGMSPLYTKDFYRIPLLLPPASIQSKIVEQVRTESAVLMSGTSKFVREIDLLEEYRSRLIAEVVTGQVDVRAISASLPDAPSGVAMQDIHEAVADGDFGADEFGEVG